MAAWRHCTLVLALATLCQTQSSILVQFKMGPFISCTSSTPQSNSTITRFMESSLILQINSRCSCNLNSSHLSSSHSLCNRDDPHYPTFRTTISSHASYSAHTLATYVEEWVLQSSASSDGLGYFTIDSACPVYPSEGSGACGKAKDSSYTVEVLAGSLVAEFVGLSIVFCLIMAAILTIYSNRLKRRSRNMKVRQQKRKRLNSSVSHDSYNTRSESSRIDIASVRMQSCSAYATSI